MKEYGQPTLRPELVSQIRVDLDSAGAGDYEMLASIILTTGGRLCSSTRPGEVYCWEEVVDKSRPRRQTMNILLVPLVALHLSPVPRSEYISISTLRVGVRHHASDFRATGAFHSSWHFLCCSLQLTSMSSSALIAGEKEHQ